MFDDKALTDRTDPVDSFIDADGVTWVRPALPVPYESRAAPWLRGLLVIAVVALGWLFLRVNGRAGQDPKESFAAVWLKYSDVWVKRMESNLDARSEVLAGDESKVTEMFTFFAFPEPASLSPELQDLLEALPQPTPAESIQQEASFALAFYSPPSAEMIQTCVAWDLSLLDYVSADGTAVTDAAGLAAVDGDAVLDELRSEHARARPLLQADYEAVRRAQMIASVARWVIAALAAGCIALAVWIRRRALRAIDRDNETYRTASAYYWQQRRLAGTVVRQQATATDDDVSRTPFTRPM